MKIDAVTKAQKDVTVARVIESHIQMPLNSKTVTHVVKYGEKRFVPLALLDAILVLSLLSMLLQCWLVEFEDILGINCTRFSHWIKACP